MGIEEHETLIQSVGSILVLRAGSPLRPNLLHSSLDSDPKEGGLVLRLLLECDLFQCTIRLSRPLRDRRPENTRAPRDELDQPSSSVGN